MNRAQYIEELEKFLIDISEDDREEVLDYYEGYFDDAGEENEEEVIRKLGSPEKLALSIKYNLKESNDEYAEYTEWGYEDIRTREDGEMPDQYTVVGHSRMHKSKNSGYSDNDETYKEKQNERKGNWKTTNNAKLILFIILMVFLSPFLKGLINGLLIGVIVAVAVAIGLPVIGIFVTAVVTFALGVAGIALAATAIPLLFTNIAVGILMIGLALFLLAAVFIGIIIIRWIAVTVLPKYLKRFTETCRKFMEVCRRFFKRLRKGGNSV